jgi:hypothetical protein
MLPSLVRMASGGTHRLSLTYVFHRHRTVLSCGLKPVSSRFTLQLPYSFRVAGNKELWYALIPIHKNEKYA